MEPLAAVLRAGAFMKMISVLQIVWTAIAGMMVAAAYAGYALALIFAARLVNAYLEPLKAPMMTRLLQPHQVTRPFKAVATHPAT
jgi:hypothetical protein